MPSSVSKKCVGCSVAENSVTLCAWLSLLCKNGAGSTLRMHKIDRSLRVDAREPGSGAQSNNEWLPKLSASLLICRQSK